MMTSDYWRCEEMKKSEMNNKYGEEEEEESFFGYKDKRETDSLLRLFWE